MWQHVKLSEQICPWNTLACCCDVKKQPANYRQTILGFAHLAASSVTPLLLHARVVPESTRLHARTLLEGRAVVNHPPMLECGLESQLGLLLLLLLLVRQMETPVPRWRWQCFAGPPGYRRACRLRGCRLARFRFWVARRGGRIGVDVLLSDCQYRTGSRPCSVWPMRSLEYRWWLKRLWHVLSLYTVTCSRLVNR